MLNSVFNFSGLPEYYEDKLLVRVSESRAAATAASMSRGSRLNILAALSTEGIISSLIPLAGGIQQKQYLSEAVGAAAIPFGSGTSDVQVGTSVAQLKPGTSLKRVLRELRSDPRVEYAEPIPVRYLCGTPVAMPPQRSTLWNLKKIRWDESRSLDIKQADEITVAVLDTGIEENHPDLQGRITSYDNPVPDAPSDKDLMGHGTHVAGIIGAVTNRAFGVTGICRCKLKIWKIFSDEPQFMDMQNAFSYEVDPIAYLRALEACAADSVDVLNLSIGGSGQPSPDERDAFQKLLESGTVIVAAMGNERTFGSPSSYPAAIPGVIAVGATNVNDRVTSFSSRGDHICLCAPGQAIWSTLPTYPGQWGFWPKYVGRKRAPDFNRPIPRETDYDAWNGTSMAAPHVAAAVALLLANRGKSSPASVRSELERCADKVDAMGGNDRDADYGTGRLNLLTLLQ